MPIEAEQIRTQLARINADALFVRAPRMQGLLSYVVSEELAGRGDRLKGYTVGVEALGKSADFDPSSDAGVRVETGRLRRMLAAYYAEHGDPVLIELPKGTYRPRFSERSASAADPLEALLAPSTGPSVAVLPFKLATGSATEQLLAVGLREELLNRLFRFREFFIVDASGVDPADEARALARCAEELECEFVLRGRVHDDGREVAVHVSVTDLQLGRMIWVHRVRVQPQPVGMFEMIYDIARDMAIRIATPTGVLPRSAAQKRAGKLPADWSTADCVLRWHLYRLRDRSPQSHAALREQVQRLLSRDPGFAAGYAILAMLTLDELVYRLNPQPGTAPLDRARYLIEQGLSIDSSDALAHYIRGQLCYFQGDLDGFRRALEQALTLNSANTDIIHHGGAFTGLAGDWERGEVLLERAGMRYHTGIGYRLGHIMREYFRGDPAEGRALLASAFVPPGFAVAHVVAALVLARSGATAEAEAQLRRAFEADRSLGEHTDALTNLWFADPAQRAIVQAELHALVARMDGNVSYL